MCNVTITIAHSDRVAGTGRTMPSRRRQRIPEEQPCAASTREDWTEAGVEPGLVETLMDPLVHLVMKRDGVSMPELLDVVVRARLQLFGRGIACGPDRASVD